MSKGYDLGDLFRSARETPRSATAAPIAPLPPRRSAEREPLPPQPMSSVQPSGRKVTKKVTYELSAELVDRVNAFAREHSMKKFSVIERALQEYLDRNGG